MIRVLLLLTALCFSSMVSYAQIRSDYDILPDESEIVYKGICTFDDLVQIKNFNFKESSETYKPDKKTVRLLKKSLKEYQLVIMLGTWCEDSFILLPHLYTVLKEAKYPVKPLLLHAFDRDKKGKFEEEIEYKVHFVPSIIVMKDGKEKGRITESVNESLEKDLLKIIQ